MLLSALSKRPNEESFLIIGRSIMHIIEEIDDPLNKKINIDWSTAKRNPYASQITDEQRLKMLIEIAFEKSKMTKEQFKKEIEKILA